MTTADVSVRVAWAQDAAGIAAVQLRAWQQRYDALLPDLLAERGLDPETHADAWQASLARPPEARHRALVALERVTVVGFALTGPASDPDADPATDGALGEFTIDPRHLRQGHGSRLLQAAVDTLVADGFTRVTTWVDSTDDDTPCVPDRRRLGTRRRQPRARRRDRPRHGQTAKAAHRCRLATTLAVVSRAVP